ncbi:hypothetical protein G3480_19095 [Thiorhodococcus mannitoliphagus]|uniref:Uncharacterized protein n=1 Tax=Thiorhodococcus mannitoliphagus TaxID=329406 RepID=A0A6P1DVL6_9GAMM|nr:hypothetical protein [Thiorhodococcus mannitoliphagus]NEX22387.1 hypothetical protein [Thiorhodococcus mannitoliphagus]
MSRNRPKDLSSRELLARIGLSDDAPTDLLDDAPLEDLSGDLGAALRERYQSLVRRHPFAPGDLVSWKPGLRNKRIPRYDQPAVVIEVLDTPALDREDEAGSTYFREPLDLVLGVISDSHPGRGELFTWHFDSRRFQPWSEAE